MTFEEIVDQALAMLQRRGRMAYRTLKRQFNLDDEALEDLKVELIDAQRVAADEDGKVLVWTAGTAGPKAWQHARQVLDLARLQKTRGEEALALHQLGVLHAHAAPPDAESAETHHRLALDLADELGMRPLMAHCHLGLGTLYAKSDRREQATAEFSSAIALYRAMDMTFWLPEAEAVLAQVEKP
jgi:hypothetical protein